MNKQIEEVANAAGMTDRLKNLYDENKDRMNEYIFNLEVVDLAFYSTPIDDAVAQLKRTAAQYEMDIPDESLQSWYQVTLQNILILRMTDRLKEMEVPKELRFFNGE